jgi:catechol 2,3-dioxygenase-like lactoylglutathione lyase family enzyme
MQHHQGRLIDHLHLRVRDLERSKRLYGAVATLLSIELRGGEGWFSIDELFVSEGANPSGPVHLAFQALDRATVDRFHEVALAAGGRDHGGPGERHYHPGYYAAFVVDLDGNNLEAVNHGPSARSAASVVVTAGA